MRISGASDAPVRIHASITSADPLQLGREVGRLIAAGVDAIHLDIADGVFVPDLTFGLRVVRAIASVMTIPLDVHLMCVRPEDLLPDLADIADIAGRADGGHLASDTRRSPRIRVAAHIEASPYPWRTLAQARALGLSIGLAINPATPLQHLGGAARAVDFVSLLTTEPDRAGELLLPDSCERVATARALLPPDVALDVDGGVTLETIGALAAAGAREFVLGRALVSSQDLAGLLAALRDAAARGVAEGVAPTVSRPRIAPRR